MSYVESSDQGAADDTRFEEKENLAILRQEGHQAPLAGAIPSRRQPTFFKPQSIKSVG